MKTRRKGLALNKIRKILSYFEQGIKEKDDLTSTVVSVVVCDDAFVIKRYNKQGVFASLRVVMNISRGGNFYYFSKMLAKNNIATVNGLAIYETFNWNLSSVSSYLIMPFYQGETLNNYFQDSYAWKTEDWISIFQQLIMILKGMWKHRLIHHDLKPCNLLYSGKKLYLIDLDYMSKTPCWRNYNKLKEKELSFLALFLEKQLPLQVSTIFYQQLSQSVGVEKQYLQQLMMKYHGQVII